QCQRQLHAERVGGGGGTRHCDCRCVELRQPALRVLDEAGELEHLAAAAGLLEQLDVPLEHHGRSPGDRVFRGLGQGCIERRGLGYDHVRRLRSGLIQGTGKGWEGWRLEALELRGGTGTGKRRRRWARWPESLLT